MKTVCDQSAAVEEVLKHISQRRFFCLHLSGPLGAGKTTLVRDLLYRLGLPEHEPVQSPTFTYVYEYQIGRDKFLHFDFYRLRDDSERNDLVDFEINEVRGIFVEWYKPKVDWDRRLTPTLAVQIDYLDEGTRKYQFDFIGEDA